jgi:hypothetical protein
VNYDFTPLKYFFFAGLALFAVVCFGIGFLVAALT